MRHVARIAAAIFALATLGAVAVGAFGPASWRDALGEGGPGCPFLAITRVPCPFCGMTRASIALGHGDLHAALALHPLAPIVLVVVLALCTIVALGHADTLRRPRRVAGILLAIGLIWAVRLIV